MGEIVRLKNKMDKELLLIKEMDKYFEQWKIIEECPNHEISSFGRVRNTRTKMIRNILISVQGYNYVFLYLNGVRKNLLIHKLVAKAFISNPDNKPNVSHISINRFNNNINNLRWVTASERPHSRKEWKTIYIKHYIDIYGEPLSDSD